MRFLPPTFVYKDQGLYLIFFILCNCTCKDELVIVRNLTMACEDITLMPLRVSMLLIVVPVSGEDITSSSTLCPYYLFAIF